MFRGEEHPCPYLPGRTAQSIFTFPLEPDGADYQLLLDGGFRRSGDFFYRPDCFDCHACTPIRVLVDRFRPSRSQRRAVRRNRDVCLRIGTPRLDDERWNLYRRYEAYQHERPMIESREEFVGFFCESPIETIEMEYRIGGRLAGIGIVDVSPTALSSVYFYFEPEYARRSLGVYSAVCEIDARGGFDVGELRGRYFACLADFRPDDRPGPPFAVAGCAPVKLADGAPPTVTFGEGGVEASPAPGPE